MGRQIKIWQPRQGQLLSFSVIKPLCPCHLSVTLCLLWVTWNNLHFVVALLEFRLWNAASHTVFAHTSNIQAIWKTHFTLSCLEGFRTPLAFVFGRVWSHCELSRGRGTSLPWVSLSLLAQPAHLAAKAVTSELDRGAGQGSWGCSRASKATPSALKINQITLIMWLSAQE